MKDVGRKPGYVSAIHAVVDRLFVYGTLRTGQTARSLIANHVVRWELSTCRGRMFAFPMGYPGIVDGEDRVHGELVWLRDLAAAFALLDAYEGDEFRRTLRQCWRADGQVEWAWCYVLSDPQAVSAGDPIPDGDWVRYWQSTLG